MNKSRTDVGAGASACADAEAEAHVETVVDAPQRGDDRVTDMQSLMKDVMDASRCRSATPAQARHRPPSLPALLRMVLRRLLQISGAGVLVGVLCCHCFRLQHSAVTVTD